MKGRLEFASSPQFKESYGWILCGFARREMTQSPINSTLVHQTECMDGLCNGFAYPSMPGLPRTPVLGVSACLVVSWCPSGQVPSMVAIAIATGARREDRLLMIHVLNCEGTIDPNRREVNLSRAFKPSSAFAVRSCSGEERSLNRGVQVWLVCGCG